MPTRDVRIVDRSPHPDLLAPEKKPFPFTRPGAAFDGEAVNKVVKTTRKKLPNVRSILNLYPKYDEDDAWAVHFGEDGKVVVEVESRVMIDLHDTDHFNPDPPRLPRAITSPKQRLVVRHTIAIRLIAQDTDSLRYWEDRPKGLAKRLKRIHDWLYCNPELDRRVTSVERWIWESTTAGHDRDRRKDMLEMRALDPDHFRNYSRIPLVDPYATDTIDPTLDEALAFLAQRQQGGCEPLTSFFLPPSPPSDPITPERFYEIVSLLPRTIRNLVSHKSVIQNLHQTQHAIAALDQHLASLYRLTISHEYHHGVRAKRSHIERTPLSGIPQLRNFTMHLQSAGIDLAARYMCRLGGKHTYHQDLDVHSIQTARETAKMAKEVKPYVLNRRTYRWGNDWALRPEDEDYHEEVREKCIHSEWGDYWVTDVGEMY